MTGRSKEAGSLLIDALQSLPEAYMEFPITCAEEVHSRVLALHQHRAIGTNMARLRSFKID